MTERTNEEETTFEVICSNGDRAEAGSPEAAILAARTLERDHFDACPVQGRGRDLTFAFWFAGKLIRSVGVKDLR